MEDSNFSHTEYQMVLETEAESLLCQDFERILDRDSPNTRMKIYPTFPGDKATYIIGTNDLFPAGPLTNGGTVSGYQSKSYAQEIGSLYAKELTVVIQETRDTPRTAATTKEIMGTKTAMEEDAEEEKEKYVQSQARNSKLYLILPSYAEQHKAKNNMIIAKEKTKLCSNAFYKNIVDNVEFCIAFANSRNIKNIIVRTRI